MPLTASKVENQVYEFFKATDVISVYSRKQALEDGTLVDVSPMAEDCGFKYPVALTARVWGEVVIPPIEAQSFQDDIGRLWDLLTCLRMASGKSNRESELKFQMIIQNEPGRGKTITLKTICGPGDHGEPTITIMMNDED